MFDDHIGGDWRERHDDPALWAKVLEIPDEELWAARNALRQYLFAFIRERARSRWKEEHVSAPRVVAAGTLLDPNALTLGFARRFTGYKRPELIFHNPERLMNILNAPRRPVQIVFAGKAHPADETGKHHLQQVYRRAIDPMFGGRIAFVDDYDLHVAHFLVQGCDVWLNNPRKPLEASGTSGMKASVNGVPHLSIGDGWWAEGYNAKNGWLIEGRARVQRSGGGRRRGRRRALQPARERDRPGVLRSRHQRHPAPLAAGGPRGDRHGHPAVQRAPDGEGVRDDDVRPGDPAAHAVAVGTASARAARHAKNEEPRARRVAVCHSDSVVGIRLLGNFGNLGIVGTNERS